MIVIIDNYDSFVHNLARYVRLAGHPTKIIRNDAMIVEQVLDLKPEAIIISPGPNGPHEAGISVELIKAAYKTIPILGVCLGHQCIGVVFGGKTAKSRDDFMAKLMDGGFACGAVLGIPLGILLGYNRRIGAFIEPTIQLSRSMQGFAVTGLSAWNVVGNLAQRLDFVKELATTLGAVFSKLRGEFELDGGAIIAFEKGLGLAHEELKGIGEVGTNTASTGSLAAQAMSSRLSPVTKASCQIPLRGYSIATMRV